MASSAGGRKPPRPPVGGPASRATPFQPSPENAARPGGDRKPLKSIGERRPDETGMLEMVPLSNDKDKSEAEQDPSATAFFAIPAPKAERARPAGPPSPGLGGPVGVAPPPPPGPIGVSPIGRPPIAGPPVIGGQVAPPPQPMVQGPVVSYGNAAGSTPFGVAGPGPVAAPGADSGQRTQSTRVYAIILAVIALVGVAVVAAVWLKPGSDDKDTAPPPVVVTTTEPKRVKAEPVDSGEPPPAPAPAPARPRTPSAPRAPTPAPASGPATLTVKLADAGGANAVEVVCPSGFRQRSALSGGSGSIASVPQEKCTMYFKGGAPAQFGPVRGGQSLNCNIVGTTAVCN